MRAIWAALGLIILGGCGLSRPNIHDEYYQISTTEDVLGEVDTAYDRQSASGNFILGEFHSQRGTLEDDEQAVEFFMAAAQQGHTDAQHRLGELLLSGRGTDADPERAAKWLRRAAKEGIVDAQTSLGALYEFGIGLPQEHHTAEKWYRIAAKRGDTGAMLGLGRMLKVRPSDDLSPQQEAFDWFKRAAELGNPEGMFQMAQMYRQGIGIRKSPNKAIEFYQLAAEHNYPAAYVQLAQMYQDGDGIEANEARSDAYFKEAIAMGEGSASVALAIQYEIGDRVEKNPEEAVKLYQAAAENGYPYAAYRLGAMAVEGVGMPASRPKAVQWFEQALAGGMTAANVELGLLEFTRPLAAKTDYIKAYNYFKNAAHNNDPLGMYLLSILYRQPFNGIETNMEKSVMWFEQAENTSGSAFAKFRVGRLFQRGRGFDQNDEQAFRWFLWSAEQGVPEAQLAIADAYHDGYGVRQDFFESMNWYKAAAAQNITAAMYNIAIQYYNGQGVTFEDHVTAFEWFTLAAQHHYRPAQFRLGQMYHDADGVPQNDIHAYAWWMLSFDKQYEARFDALNKLIARMTPYELKQGVAMKKELEEKYHPY